MASGDLLWTGQVARLCGVTPAAVFKWIRAGALPASRTPGGQYRVRPNDLTHFLKERGALIPAELVDHPVRVLVVDDDAGVVQVVCHVLKHRWPDWEVASAKDGYEAGKLIHTLEPDLVLLDLRMPTVDGFAVCRDVKSDARTRHIRILVMTGFASDENVQLALDAGADSIVRKPLTPRQIEHAVESVLEQPSQSRAKGSPPLAGPADRTP